MHEFYEPGGEPAPANPAARRIPPLGESRRPANPTARRVDPFDDVTRRTREMLALAPRAGRTA